jgi:hypothetical protein
MQKSVLFGSFVIAGFFLIQPQARADVPDSYRQSVHDAMSAEATEIANTLDAITPSNESLSWNDDKTLLKVVTWKSQAAYDKFLLPATQTSPNPDFAIWVTAAPKVQNFCRAVALLSPEITPEALNLRLKQYLGLNPEWQYDVMIELWVNPADLFRPCVDPDPSDSSCELDFGNNKPVVKNISDYQAFYKALYYKSFRSEPGVPWTGLGYTYDWKNASLRTGLNGEQGASEFILAPSSHYKIERVVPTFEYCSP